MKTGGKINEDVEYCYDEREKDDDVGGKLECLKYLDQFLALSKPLLLPCN